MSEVMALCRALGLGDRPDVVLEPLRALYAELDAAVAAGASGRNLPCRAGCDACCHESVFLSAPELLAVAAELFTWPAAERRSVVDAMCDVAARFEDELLLLETLPPGAERDEVAARVKFSCPLLSAEGRCTVYGVRELNARTFGLTWDSANDAAYGCGLTHERLRVLPPEVGPSLFDARRARQQLAERVPGTEQVHVYPWWFARYRAQLL